MVYTNHYNINHVHRMHVAMISSKEGRQNEQIETISSEIERFSRDWNCTMSTIVYLKNEILLMSFPLTSRQLVHCELIELEFITL